MEKGKFELKKEKFVPEKKLFIEHSLVEVKVIKKKFLDQIDFYKNPGCIDLDWLQVFGYYNVEGRGLFKMILFMYHKKLYKLDLENFASRIKETNIGFENIPQIFVD